MAGKKKKGKQGKKGKKDPIEISYLVRIAIISDDVNNPSATL